MENFTRIESILKNVRSEIETHLKYKKEYDKQLALDFSLFNFFSIGENKVSQVLAYFLNEKENHGQGNLFLKEFLKTFYDKEVLINNSINICEKVISQNRRLDIYIELQGLTIAIENKIWADDQPDQLRDYANFLEKTTQGDYLLIYLSPYGEPPSPNSISDTLKQSLVEQKKLKFISYKQDIIGLINNWITKCEADNVSHFLKEFKKYLEVKFLGKNTLNMSKELREIIYNNKGEVQQLVQEFRKIENEIESKLNAVANELQKTEIELNPGLKIQKYAPFNYGNKRIYQLSISKGDNVVVIKYEKEDINLYSTYHLAKETDLFIHEILSDLKINKNLIIDYNQSTLELVNILLGQVKLVKECFRIYDERMGI